MSDYIYTGKSESELELKHYGVLGMKWGVRKAERKMARSRKLQEKSLEYRKRAATMQVKSEKAHSKKDLEKANRQSVKTAKLHKKAESLALKAHNNEANPYKQARLQKKSSKLEYQAAKSKLESDKLAKTTGYGSDAMKYMNKANKFEAKAAKAQYKVQKNNSYVMAVKKKTNEAFNDDNTIKQGYEFVETFLKDYDNYKSKAA